MKQDGTLILAIGPAPVNVVNEGTGKLRPGWYRTGQENRVGFGVRLTWRVDAVFGN